MERINSHNHRGKKRQCGLKSKGIIIQKHKRKKGHDRLKREGIVSQKHKGKKKRKLLHERVFRSSLKSELGLHYLCFTSVCDCKTKINRELFAPEFLRF